MPRKSPSIMSVVSSSGTPWTPSGKLLWSSFREKQVCFKEPDEQTKNRRQGTVGTIFLFILPRLPVLATSHSRTIVQGNFKFYFFFLLSFIFIF